MLGNYSSPMENIDYESPFCSYLIFLNETTVVRSISRPASECWKLKNASIFEFSINQNETFSKNISYLDKAIFTPSRNIFYHLYHKHEKCDNSLKKIMPVLLFNVQLAFTKADEITSN